MAKISRRNRIAIIIVFSFAFFGYFFQYRANRKITFQRDTRFNVEDHSDLEEMVSNYIEKHRKWSEMTLEDQLQAPYLIYTPEPTYNLADRIFGLTSSFLFALITDRYFFVDWPTEPTIDQYGDIRKMPNMDSLFHMPFNSTWTHLEEELNSHSRVLRFNGNCYPRKDKVMNQPYEILKCANYTEFFEEFQVIRVKATDFYADWFEHNSYLKHSIAKIYPKKESIFGPLYRKLIEPVESIQLEIQLEKKKSFGKYDHVICVSFWQDDSKLKSPEKIETQNKEETAVLNCVKDRMADFSRKFPTKSVGVYLHSDSISWKQKAKRIFVENSFSTEESGISQDFVEMNLIGQSNEIILGSFVSNFTKISIAKNNSIAIFDGLTCSQNNSSSIRIGSSPKCMKEGKCGSSMKHPWREDFLIWFLLRSFIGILICFVIVYETFKSCSLSS